MKKKLFIYGSLIEGFFNYDIYLKGKVLESESARIKGELYHLNGERYPALIDGDDYVYGEFIQVDDYEETLKALDEMEHYYGEGNEYNEYNRVLKEIEVLTDNRKEEAYVYMYNYKELTVFKEENLYIPHGDWKRYMER
ncbi:gamma-glutamylcyclotransferase family protein [Brassicibacter mesophilus]|uniref:gamma-glutamylcyclotransferase family protein n=1 Tax=Brassicibacter mesophilus TaxID=745119 RepID=UPI003D24C35D